MRRCRAAFLVGVLVFLPAAAFAQASITGVVKDSSGAVLPGVTVEASSPELIEKVRIALTDDAGRYRIVDLRAGVYAMTFSLPGFSAVRREGITLSGTFTATVDAEMRVGSLEETITVTGESPIVDVQVAGTLRSDQGGDLAANWAAPNSATVGLNRPFAGLASPTLTVNLIEPGTLYGDRVNELNLRFAKFLRFGRTRSNVGVDIYNVGNVAPVLTYNQTYSPTTTTWLRPNTVLQARYVKLSAQFDF